MDAAGAVRGLVSCNDSLGASGDVAQRRAMRPRMQSVDGRSAPSRQRESHLRCPAAASLPV